MDRDLEKALQELEIGGSPSALSIGADWQAGAGEKLTVHSPIDGSELASFPMATAKQVESAIDSRCCCFSSMARYSGAGSRRARATSRQRIPRKKRRSPNWLLGKSVRSCRKPCGEVQEIIDICDFAVGLSRQLYGKTISSERPGHRLTEYWHPLGPVGVISAFNFPVAVWAWNAMIGLVCGDPIVWKPSEKTPLSAIACQRIMQKVVKETSSPAGISSVVIGGVEVGQALERIAAIAVDFSDGQRADGAGGCENGGWAAGAFTA